MAEEQLREDNGRLTDNNTRLATELGNLRQELQDAQDQ